MSDFVVSLSSAVRALCVSLSSGKEVKFIGSQIVINCLVYYIMILLAVCNYE
jgi:hypothetical protein